jgi:predicted RNA-binding protein YlxR (DUF448 family)
VRLALDGDRVVADPGRARPGRGAYVCRSRHCLEQAIRGRKLDKGLKTRVDEKIIAALTDELAALPPEPEEERDVD